MPNGSRRPDVRLFGLALILLTTPTLAFASGADAVPGLTAMGLRAVLSLAGVLALIAALAFLVRRLRTPGGSGPATRRVVPLDRLDLGGHREIRLLRVEKRLLLVGVTGERIALLSELPDTSVGASEESGALGSGLSVLRKLTNSS